MVRSISSLIPTVTEVEVLKRQLMLDIHTLVEVDESYRKALITELSSVMSHKYDCISGLLLVGCRLCQQLYRLK